MSISFSLLDLAIRLIDQIGYGGIALILVLDNAGVPIPSEVILGLSGAAARHGSLEIVPVVIIGILAQTIGSCLAFGIGAAGGEKLVRRYGKYFLISLEDYQKSKKWFTKHGPRAIFVSRLTPVVRTFMGFAAGGAKMDFMPFVWQSLAGSALWTAIWVGIGYILGDSWHQYYEYMHYIDYVVLTVMSYFVIRFIWRRLQARKLV